MKLKVIATVFSCLTTTLAYAQCAPGVPSAGNPGCIPLDRPESPYFHGNPDQLGAQPPSAPATWEDRWGAIALDSSSGSLGIASQRKSKSEAKSEAIDDCKREGGKDCKLVGTYHNQCAAVVYGKQRMGYGSAATIPEAITEAIKGCGLGESCKPIYSNCSLTERIQ
jgi:hypothetical protein